MRGEAMTPQQAAEKLRGLGYLVTYDPERAPQKFQGLRRTHWLVRPDYDMFWWLCDVGLIQLSEREG